MCHVASVGLKHLHSVDRLFGAAALSRISEDDELTILVY